MALQTEREKGAHLLRRFGLGASEAELDYYLQNGLKGAIDRLLEPQGPDAPPIDLEILANGKGVVRMPQVVGWWVLRLIETRHPLRERMTVFWHDHFATSASKVNRAGQMLQQNEILRAGALGSFRDLLQNVSKDPAMLFWLDNQENVRGKPNENFAREVMELFTLGVDQGYTERDVQEAARAFTGWSFRRRPGEDAVKGGGEFLFRPFLHDNGPKSVLGVQGNLTGEDVLNLLCDRPRTSEYLVTKIWEWFVYPRPEPAVVARLAKGFRESDLDIKRLLRVIMESPEFYSDRAERAVVKNPVDFCISTLRQLGVGARFAELASMSADDRRKRALLFPASAAATTMKSMGMWLLYPPDVAGWETGTGWISSATMVERIGWADRIFGESQPKKPSLRYPAYPLLADNPTPEGIVHRLVSIFDAPIKPERRKLLIEAAAKGIQGELTPTNANPTATAVTRLIFASPEFQFA